MKNYKYIIPIIYFILCLIISFNRIPFWDEARAWLIAQNCNPIEYLSMMRLECHLSLWYILISPFAKLDLFYPYSIYIVNALIATFSIFILWQKSPFDNLQKFLITFGVPFLFLWGSVARCYSLGILFLFLALSIYNDRFKKPYKYLILLCLSAHTSVMAFIGAFFLAIVFLFENFRKKDFYKLIGLFSLSSLLILIQIYDINPDYLKQAPEMAFLRDFIGYIVAPIIYVEQYKIQSILMSLLRISVLITAFGAIFYAFKKNKKILFFIISTYFSMVTLFTFFYSGNFWHYFYFYLYFIVFIWILENENQISKFLKIMTTIILTLFLFKGSLFIDSKMTTINNSHSKNIAMEIQKEYKDKKIFCLDAWSDIAPSALPFLKNIIIYDRDNNDRKSFKSMRSQIKFNLEKFNPDDFSKYVDKDSILITTGVFLEHEIDNPLAKFDRKTNILTFIGKENIVKFIPLKSWDKIHLYSYLIKVNN